MRNPETDPSDSGNPVRRKKVNYRAPALEKGLDILELLIDRQYGMAQADICRALNIHRQTVWLTKKEEPDFAEAVAAAELERDLGLEAAARKRAYANSDTLLIFLLKGAFPEKYRDNHKVDITGRLSVAAMSEDDIKAELASYVSAGLLAAPDDEDIA